MAQIDYKLAKQLKEVGLHSKQEKCGDGFYCPICGDYFDGYKGFCDKHETVDGIGIPTLSELIRECGDGFAQITHWKNNEEIHEWIASRKVFYDDAGYRDIIGGGETPEEAVARLYIKLNE